MSLLTRFFRSSRDEDAALAPLYRAIVAEARDPDWYRAAAVPDTLDGRFDMVAAVLALVLIRLEAVGEAAAAALLTERFIADMDAQLRERGIGDLVVGKHVGRMMSALGGRIAAYREALAGPEDLDDALARNLYRGVPPAPAALAHAAARLRALHLALAAKAPAALLGGSLA